MAIVGPLTGVAHELIKNLVLKGVGHLQLVSWDGMPSLPHYRENVLFQLASDQESLTDVVISQSREMNPSVKITLVKLPSRESLRDWKVGEEDGDEDEEGASVVVLVNVADLEVAKWLDVQAKKQKAALLWLLTRGMQVLQLSSLGENYQFEEEIKAVSSSEMALGSTIKLRRVRFLGIDELWSQHQENKALSLKRRSKGQPLEYSPEFAQIQVEIEKGCFWIEEVGNAKNFIEVAPVNAIMGAIATQEVVKVVTKRDLPLHNVVIFNGTDLSSMITSVGWEEY